MNTKKNKLKKQFEKLKRLDFSKYKELLKIFCQQFHVPNESLDNLVDMLSDYDFKSDYDEVLKKVNSEIMLIEVYSKFVEELDNKENNDQVEELDNKKNNDQGLTL
jgi:hypothetical protein